MAIIKMHTAFTQAETSAKRTHAIADSTFLQHIEYDPATLQLTVTMKNGAQYLHNFVYPNTVDDLLKAPSKGSFYAKNIKGVGQTTRIITKNVGPKIKKGEKENG